ncbi:aminoglycoside 3'-phosphotransferase [Sporosarcina sp. Sa2YVA2]|uniref:Aminoglycoside 3'-phosphotransferase n=1 Tax=Sporosarcina quadrami TaxID=2762234 RepID=A0ABR8UD46_9BACL|nr:aminoglycoside 3'-phosphotransferase [Sporosarcina quadrami]
MAGQLPVSRVLFYGEEASNEYLLATEVDGVNAAVPSHLSNLPSVLGSLGAGLKRIHRVPIDNCPFDQRLDRKLAEARRRVDQNLVDEDHFDAERIGKTAVELFGLLLSQKPHQEELVFAHGDFCLPNVLIANDEVSGFIDWGRAGIADKYQDLALAIRSITSKFGKEFVPFFLTGYGLAEVDEERVFYYQLLDEFF